MSFHHRILAFCHQPVRLTKAVGRSIGLVSTPCLRVLLCHDIAPQDRDRFAEQLRWLARSWSFVSPGRFAAMASGEEAITGRNLLLTFDDGFASNRVVAEQVLKPMGIHALFFVVSDFVALEDRDEARSFIARHILPGTNVAQVPPHMHNMRWPDLEALLEQGHLIGGHTCTHARLSQITTATDLDREINASADTLAQHLGLTIEHFAYPFGDLASFSEEALAIARRRYRFVYSGLRGENAGGISPFAIRRDAVTTHDSMALLGAYLEGAADFNYARSRARLGNWVSNR